MDKKIGILHLSDAHISKENKSTIDRLIALLQKDITLIQKEMYVDIKMVCVSGDLINSGDNADAELDIALGSFLQPLMEMLGLREDSIFLVPGNHEVKRNSIVNYIENGLASTLITENNIDEFLSSIDDHSLERILYFDRDFARLFGGNPVWESSLTRAYMVNTGTLTIGVSCVNSAWRSTGIGSGEKRKMIVGRKQIVDSFEKIKNADMSDRNYLNYTNELLYFTGLNRQNKEIVSVLQEALSQDFDKLRSVVPSLDEYNIGLDISLPEEKFSEKIKQTKLSQEQSDRIQNTKDTSETKTPEEMDKQVEHEEMDAFIQTLLVYGNCLKNLELLSKKEKEEMYNYYIYGLCIMLGIFKRTTEEYFNSEISDMEQLPEKYTPEDLNKVKALMEDVLKISLPLALENIALENIGTTKLKSIIERGFEDGSRDEFSRFFSVFLYCDLRLPGLQNVLKSYCTDAKDKSLLKIIFFKLLYYYRFRYFSSSLDPFFENILADINIKLNGGSKLRKGAIIQELKKQKKFLNA